MCCDVFLAVRRRKKSHSGNICHFLCARGAGGVGGVGGMGAVGGVGGVGGAGGVGGVGGVRLA